jgi:ethanolamine permease
MAGVATGYFLYIIVLIAGVSLPPGIGALSVSKHPLADGLLLLFPDLRYTACVGIASIGAIATITPWLYGYNRQVFALSRKGFIPSIFSRVHNGVPYTSLIFSCVTGYALVILLLITQDPTVIAVSYGVANLSTMFSYIWMNVIFIALRLKYPDMHRNYRSFLGLTGSVMALMIYIIVFVFLILSDPDNNFIGATFYFYIVLFAVWVPYFLIVSKKYLVLDDDERRAIITTLHVQSVLKTQYGFVYLEEHCLKEMNPESLYGLCEAKKLLGQVDPPLSLEEFKTFCDTFVLCR